MGILSVWLRRAFKNSLAGKIAAAVLISTILVTAAGSTAAFLVYREAALRGALDTTLAYLRERRKTEERVFRDIRDIHRTAARLYERRLARLDRAQASRAFDRLFPMQADGTRRSVDLLFDGGRGPDGVDVSGIGSFIANGAVLTRDEKVELYAAYLVLRDMGPIVQARLDNIYFFTSANRMVMFAPNREDRLEYYRHRAPASFAFQHEEFAVISSMAANPGALTRCTGLRSLMSDPSGVRLSSACTTPMDLAGRRVGVWGSSIVLANGLRASVEETLPGAHNAILDRHGDLIAHAQEVGGDNREAAANLGISRVMDFVRASGESSGVMPEPVNGNYVVFARIAGPDWIFLTLIPSSSVSREASQSAGWFLLIGVLAVLAQVLLLAFLMYRWVVRPTLALTQAAGAGSALAIDELTHRADEIGELARALAERDSRDRERLNDLAVATANAEAANVAKSQFLATMSHELRTPLNAIIGYSEIMREDAEDDGRDVVDHDRVLTAARRLLHLINEILDLSKVEAGRVVLEVRPCNVGELVRDALDAVTPQATANGNTLRLEMTEHLPLARTDSFKLGQCLLNLLSNASKFTKDGEIGVRVRMVDERFVFEVWDSGIGIPPDKLAVLFQPFVQADSSTTRTHGGTGLGLVITQRMAQLMGGDVTVTSEMGKGSVFTLSVATQLIANDADLDDDVAAAVGD